MAASRDPERTRRRILQAARRAFAEHGPAGARIDRIAAAAGINKRMLYHYFGSKDGLFAAVQAEVLAGIDLGYGGISDSLRNLGRERDALRLWAWEALEGSAAFDSAAWGGFYDRLRAQPGFPDGQAALALLAVALMPVILGPLGKRITGLDPNGEDFAADHGAFLERMVSLLAVPSAEAPTRIAASRPRTRYRYRWPTR